MATNKIPLSIVILTKNEEKIIDILTFMEYNPFWLNYIGAYCDEVS